MISDHKLSKDEKYLYFEPGQHVSDITIFPTLSWVCFHTFCKKKGYYCRGEMSFFKIKVYAPTSRCSDFPGQFTCIWVL